MEQAVCYECVATFRNAANAKKRVIYQACPMKTAYKEGLAAFTKEFGQSAADAGFTLAEISVRDSVDLHRQGRVDGCALNAYTLEQLQNPDLIP